MGGRLSAGFKALADDGEVDHVRGLGGMWAVGLHPHQNAMHIRDRMLEESNVICRALNTDALCFCPPLVTTDEQVDRIVDAVADAVRASS
jgi:adenosylmethionine-8-amino-7-oxononanoate aminotransferase